MMSTYADAGVSIDAGNSAVDLIRKHVEATYASTFGTPVGSFGGFSGLMELPKGHRIVGCTTDGVGTKLKLAIMLDKHDTVGIDLVAMCANDLLVEGLTPWLFLDYLAMGKQIPERTERIVAGISDGCRQAGMRIVGGEMAEMPGMYAPEDYDLAGFAVGIARGKSKLITGKRIKPGMHVYGLPSSGPHSNGFSLIRKVFGLSGVEMDVARNILATPYSMFGNRTLGEELFKPTRIYVHEVGLLREDFNIVGLVHITGGGLIDNPPRILPEGCAVRLNFNKWAVLPIFRLIQKKGQISLGEMVRTFNMGFGMLVISSDDIEHDDVVRVGEVVEAGSKATQFIGGQELLS